MSARLVRVLGQPKLANWFCRAPSLVGSDASVHGGLRRLPHVLGRAAPVAGLGDAMVLDAYGARELRHARIIELKQKRHSGHVLSHFVLWFACEFVIELH